MCRAGADVIGPAGNGFQLFQVCRRSRRRRQPSRHVRVRGDGAGRAAWAGGCVHAVRLCTLPASCTSSPAQAVLRHCQAVLGHVCGELELAFRLRAAGVAARQVRTCMSKQGPGAQRVALCANSRHATHIPALRCQVRATSRCVQRPQSRPRYCFCPRTAASTAVPPGRPRPWETCLHASCMHACQLADSRFRLAGLPCPQSGTAASRSGPHTRATRR